MTVLRWLAQKVSERQRPEDHDRIVETVSGLRRLWGQQLKTLVRSPEIPKGTR